MGKFNFCPVPPMTDPLGRHWDQPDPKSIRYGQRFCHMSTKAFKALPEYSSTTPTGIYDGKMWKHHNFRTDGSWHLCWYAPHADPKFIAIKSRRICLTD